MDKVDKMKSAVSASQCFPHPVNLVNLVYSSVV